jgi:hypothetical protein
MKLQIGCITEMCRRVQIFVTTEESNWHFTWRPKCFSAYILRLNRQMLTAVNNAWENAVERHKIHFFCLTFFVSLTGL